MIRYVSLFILLLIESLSMISRKHFSKYKDRKNARETLARPLYESPFLLYEPQNLPHDSLQNTRIVLPFG